MYKIIIIEDEVLIGEMLTEFLQIEGYNAVLISSKEEISDLISGRDGLNKADLYIIDVHIPFLSGFEITQKLTSLYQNINVLFISGDDDIDTMSTAYNLNCYDYLKKPFKIHELILKVNKFFKYANQVNNGKSHIIKISKRCNYNSIAKEIIIDGYEVLSLTNQESKLLDALVSAPNTYFTIEKLEYIIWGELVMNGYVRHLVSRLRKKIPCNVIKNKIGKGYKLLKYNEK